MKKLLKKENGKINNTKILLILLAVVVLSLTAVGYQLTFHQVTLKDGEEQLSFKTRKETVEEALEEQEISYIKEDLITPSLDTKIEDDIQITIKRAVKVQIKADGKVHQLVTPAENVESCLKEANISLGEKDEVSPFLNQPLKENMEVIVTRALPVNIQADGKEVSLLTTAKDVKGAIEEAELTLGEKDKINPALETKIENETEIKIIRVTEKQITEKENIAFNTKRQNVSSMYKGTSKVVKKGEKGVKEKEVKVTYEDGKEVSKKVLSEKITKKPVDKVVRVGTKVKKTTATSSRGGGEVQRTLRVVATGYSSEDPGVSNRTSTGATLKRGVIAVDPRVIPYGTRIYVPGYGFGKALDTGGAIKGNKIDLAFSSRSEALRFGRKSVTIKIYGR